jgi:hypothetical protein
MSIKDNIMSSVKNAIDKPKNSIQKGFYKKVIKPDSEKKDYNVGKRLLMAGGAGLATAGLSFAALTAIKKLNPNLLKTLPINTASIIGGFSGATAGFLHPDIRNSIIDYHKHKDDKKLNDDFSKITMTKQAGWGGAVTKGITNFAGNAASTIGKTIAGGMKFGGKPTFGEKVTRFAVKGTALGGIGYGGYKAVSSATRPVSGDNYTTLLRNNILNGNISGNEISDHDKSNINNLGMR